MVTVREEISRLFNKGSRRPPELEMLRKKKKSIELFPQWPPDMFAVTAHLIKKSGAYQYTRFPKNAVDLNSDQIDAFKIYGPNRARIEKIGAAWAFLLVTDDSLKPKNRKRLARSAKRVYHWLKFDKGWLESRREKSIQKIWSKLANCDDQLIQDIAPEMNGPFPKWWRYAIQLMLISDQASKGLGFNPINANDDTWPQYALETMGQEEQNLTKGNVRVSQVTNLVSDLVDSQLVTVLPKCRTPTVGWTLRSLTHHLALLPSRGEVRAIWHHNIRKPKNADASNQNPMNILLVPFPYHIPSHAFSTIRTAKNNADGEFSASQIWLSADNQVQELMRHIRSLVDSARSDGLNVNGIVLPELALTHYAFDEISHQIASAYHDSFEFIISGVGERPSKVFTDADSADEYLEGGNFVAVRGILMCEDETRARHKSLAGINWDYNTIRNKHHRWKIDERQARRYSLRHCLHDQGKWWEGIPIGRRKLDVFQPRAGLTMTALICEDLARIDPSQEIIRAIGPNLVVALLMDGPQTAYRWPAHYAGVLADDPGCSVLTLTSYGLMERASVTDRNSSRSIAFWKDCFGQQEELHLQPGYSGLVVTLEPENIKEHTLDGRSDGGHAKGWKLAHVTPVRDHKGGFQAFTGI